MDFGALLGSGAGESALSTRGDRSPPLASSGDPKIDAYRKEYRSYRRGHAKGAKGEVGDLARRSGKVVLSMPPLPDSLVVAGPARAASHRRTNSSGAPGRVSSFTNLAGGGVGGLRSLGIKE